MAVNNISALVDREGLEYLNNSNYIEKYYLAGIANQGQRYTNEVLLEYLHFTVNELLNERYQQTLTFENAYLVITQKPSNSNFSDTNLKFYLQKVEGNNIRNIDLDISDFDNISNNDIKSILLIKKIEILKKLYFQVVNDILKDNGDSIDNISDSKYFNSKIWIPLNYEFEYVSDGINKSIIYGSNKSIYIYTEPLSIDNVEYKVALDSNKQDLIFIQFPQEYEKVCIYGYSFDKDNNIPHVIRGFILPYINGDNIWVVNGSNTGISAKAENATNLNIILAYLYKSGNNIQFNILSGLRDGNNKSFVITTNQLSEKTMYIKRRNGKTFDIKCYIPEIVKVEEYINNTFEVQKISANIIDILKNSTIILMTKLSKIIKDEDEDAKKEYKDGLITTIWTYYPEAIGNSSDPNYIEAGFNYVSLEEDENNHRLALDFSDITNFNNLINFKVAEIEQVEPDNYLHSHLIFDQIIKQNKQEVNNNFAYAVLQNINGSEYNSKYINNFNFSLRYVNNIVGTSGDAIDKVVNTSDNRYFKVPNDDAPNLVTNSIYKRIIDNRTKYYNEYIPNYNVPTFDLSEVLLKDSNVMNKQNILSFNNNGQIYYSYIGTPYDNVDKSILHIGTSETNINLGEYSLADDINKSRFLKHKGISLDFQYTYLNGYANIQNNLKVNGEIYHNKIDWEIKEIDSTTIYSTSIIPKFKYILNSKGGIYHEIGIDSMSSKLNSILLNDIKKGNYQTKDYLYCNIILSHKIKNIDYYYKYNDLLYINNLLKYLELDSIVFESITSDTNDIIYDSNNSAIFMVSSNNLLSDSIVISASSDTKISITIQNIKEIYVGNALDIIHIVKNGNHSLVINEHQSQKIKSIWKLPYKI